MKLNLRHLLILLLILVLSVGVGFGYDAIATAVEKSRHPRPAEYADIISACADEFGVPEAIIWATVQQQSGFDNRTAIGEGIGLFQLTPALLEQICTQILHTDPPDAGMLYDPRTNLRLGTAYLSSLYRIYGMWEPTLAAFFTDEATVNAWLADPACLSPQGRLVNIPDKKTAAFVSTVQKSAKMYTQLYH